MTYKLEALLRVASIPNFRACLVRMLSPIGIRAVRMVLATLPVVLPYSLYRSVPVVP